MCYMLTRTTAVPHRGPINGRVGARELRQNLSVYLERVVAGETLDVTDRGRIVAMLVPLRPGATLVDRLASALSIGDFPDAFITYDDRLAAAARKVRLRVVQPGR